MKERIMTAAVDEINERGIKFTMADLARRIGVSKRCLYQHFTSKEDLIRSINNVWLEEILQQRRAILADDSLSFEEKLKKLLCVKPTAVSPAEGRFAAEIKRFMPDEWERIENFMNGHWSIIDDFLKTGIAQGYLRPVYLPVVQKMFKGGINEIIDYGFLVRNNVSLAQAKAHMVDVLLYGLVAR